ncbi:MAG: ATP-grasp fold amidoligase family protein [Erysipelotrichaceae bacterium]|nr:hypothetical protein [Petrimonas sp.]
MKKHILKFLNQFYVYRYLAYRKHKYDVTNNFKKEADRCYYPTFKKQIDWKNPKDLIEKINWLQFNSDTSLWTKYADKYLVRDYVKECGFEDVLPILYGKWDNAKDIDFDKLPNSFVLKTNHGCGSNLIVKDKSKLNIKSAIKKLNRWLSIPYGYAAAQIHYTRIKPCIIAEELLENKDDYSSSLVDYKIWCFHGVPEAIWVAYNRSNNGVDMSLYDLNWEKHPEHLISSNHYKYNERDIPRPKSLEKMIEIAKVLSKDTPQVRVDFYDIDGKPYFGEMTFATGFGYFSREYYEYLGSKIDLSKVEKIKHI